MEKEKKFNIFKIIIIVACVVLFIGLLLPYQASTKEYKEYLQENPDAMNVEEVNLTNKDAINISMMENFKVYSYAMNNSEGNSWLAGEATINFILIIVLIVSVILTLIFTLFNKRILGIIFGILIYFAVKKFLYILSCNDYTIAIFILTLRKINFFFLLCRKNKYFN